MPATDTHSKNGSAPSGGASLLRRAVIALAGVETVVLLGYMAVFAPALWSGEAISRNIAGVVMLFAAMMLVLLVLPALLMGLLSRALKVAMSLALLALPVAGVLFLSA